MMSSFALGRSQACAAPKQSVTHTLLDDCEVDARRGSEPLVGRRARRVWRDCKIAAFGKLFVPHEIMRRGLPFTVACNTQPTPPMSDVSMRAQSVARYLIFELKLNVFFFQKELKCKFIFKISKG